MKNIFLLLAFCLFISSTLIAQNGDVEIERPAPYLKLIDSDHASDNMNANGIIGAYGNNGDGSLATGRLWYLGSSSSSSFDAIFGNQTPTGKLLFATNGAARMAIDASGNMGIGTTSPLTPLDVRSSDASRDILYSRATWAAGANSDKAAVVGINDVDAGFGVGSCWCGRSGRSGGQ